MENTDSVENPQMSLNEVQLTPAQNNSSEIRTYLLYLDEHKNKIESTVAKLINFLNQKGNPGMDGPLLDQEGFPRNDIDIYAVKEARRRVRELRNDHNNLIDHMQTLLGCLTQSRNENKVIEYPKWTVNEIPDAEVEVGITVNAQDENWANFVPMAQVGEVTKGSPAEAGGILMHDMIIRVNTVKIGEIAIKEIAAEIRRCEGVEVEIEVVRQGIKTLLWVTPKKMENGGMLGCMLLKEQFRHQ